MITPQAPRSIVLDRPKKNPTGVGFFKYKNGLDSITSAIWNLLPLSTVPEVHLAVHAVGMQVAPILPNVLVIAAQVFSLLYRTRFISIFAIFSQCAAVLSAVPTLSAQFTPVLAHITGVVSYITPVMPNLFCIVPDIAISSANSRQRGHGKHHAQQYCRLFPHFPILLE
jgi:hypothetical protein